jgi:hypothetical protein
MALVPGAVAMAGNGMFDAELDGKAVVMVVAQHPF